MSETIPEGWTEQEEIGFQYMKKGMAMIYNIVIDELPNMRTKDEQIACMRIIQKVRYLGKKTQHCDENEILLIKESSEMGLSIRDIAWIFERSTETIHKYVKQS